MNLNYKLSQDEYKKILQKDLQNFHILEITEKNISDQVTGIMGGHYKIQIKVAINDEIQIKRYFGKRMQSSYDIQNEMIKVQGAYKKEAFVYEIFLAEFNNIPRYNIDYVPKCYLAVQDEIFVLEDLQESGYRSLKRSAYLLDINHLKTTFDALAKFHAASIIYEEQQTKLRNKKYRLSDEYSQYFQEPLYRKDENYLGNKLIKTGVKAALALIDIVPQFTTNKTEVKEKFSRHVENMYNLVKPSEKYRNVLCHGDLWASNVLFKYNGNIPVAAKLIDFQALRYTIPAHDVLNLLNCSARMDFILKHQNELLLYYYESLREHLREYNIDIKKHIFYDELLESVEYILPFIIVQKAACFTQFIIEKDIDKLEYPNFFKKVMYEDRTEICLEEYVNNPHFKDIIDDALLGLNLLK